MARPPTVTVLYFAALRELAGVREERFELPEGVGTVQALSALVQSKHPTLRGRLAGIRFAVNEVFSGTDTALSDGDVIALVPPVSGG